MRATSARRLVTVAFALGAALAIPATARAFHTVFHYEVDRFEADGNVFGTADGTPDLVDEFDDGVLSPNWSVLFGTAYEQGGVLHLTNPGTHYNPGYPLDLSNVWSSMAVRDGQGDFTLTSTWVPLTIGPNTIIHMTLFDSNPGLATPWEAFGLDISNFPDGFVATQHVQRFENGNWLPPQTISVPLDPASITGSIVFRISFDDATDMATTSFSLDGGQTFASPFPAMQIFVGTSEGRVILGADPASAGDTPTTTSTTTTTTLPAACTGGAPITNAVVTLNQRSAPTGDEQLVVRGSIMAAGLPVYHPADEGTRLLLESSPGVPVLYDVTTATGANGCGGKDGWWLAGSTAMYRNTSGGMPPLCLSGTAHGLRLVTFKNRIAKNGTIKFQAKAQNASVPPPGGPLKLTLVLGSDGSSGKCAAVTLQCMKAGVTYHCK